MPDKLAVVSRLLHRFPVVQSRDFEEVRESVGRVFCEHQLQIVGRAQHLNTNMYYRRGKNIGYGRMLYGASVDIDPGKLDRFFLVQFPFRGTETIVTNNQSLLSSSLMGSLISPSMGFRMRHGQTTEKLFLRIERSALEEKFIRYYGQPLRGALEFQTGIDLTTPSGQALKQLIRWQFYHISEGQLFNRSLIAAQLEETLMLSLLDGQPHNQPVQGDDVSALAPRFVRQAEDYIRHHAHLPLTASDIAQQVNVSVRTLFAGFKRYRAQGPMAYLRDTRLEQVHKALSEPSDPNITVTEIALQWGFSHLGQFAAAYRKRWGELPSETLRRQR